MFRVALNRQNRHLRSPPIGKRRIYTVDQPITACLTALTDYGYERLFDLRMKQRSVRGNLALIVAGHVAQQVPQQDRVVVRLRNLKRSNDILSKKTKRMQKKKIYKND